MSTGPSALSSIPTRGILCTMAEREITQFLTYLALEETWLLRRKAGQETQGQVGLGNLGTARRVAVSQWFTQRERDQHADLGVLSLALELQTKFTRGDYHAITLEM